MTDYFRSLARDFGEIPPNAGKRLRKAVEDSAGAIKDAWREKLDGSYALPALTRAVGYDIGTDAGGGAGAITAVIGINKASKQGPLGNFSEFGSINNAGRGYGAASLAENSAAFDKNVEDAIDASLRRITGL